MSSLSISGSQSSTTHRRKLRLLAVAGAALGTVAVWLVADKGFGVDLHQPGFGTSTPQALNPGFVAVVGALAALLGWALLALFERLSSRGSRRWLFVALAALLVSLGGPLSGHGVSAGNRAALVCMHLVAAAVVIPLLYRAPGPTDSRRKIDGDNERL